VIFNPRTLPTEAQSDHRDEETASFSIKYLKNKLVLLMCLDYENPIRVLGKVMVDDQWDEQ